MHEEESASGVHFSFQFAVGCYFVMMLMIGMELTQKKTSVTFKQLDGTLRTMDKDTGKRISLSHKCGELDKQIPQLLGVSKSILEHVRCFLIYCSFFRLL
jgi:hypothetical protein